ncbi:MAG: hypothetical protein NT057_06505 [Actinobacteria bacterium]|nr:hypothetical protein [Actinomycetota bacterium]
MKRGLLIGVGTLGGLGAVFAITPPQFGTGIGGGGARATLSGGAATQAAPAQTQAAAPAPAQTQAAAPAAPAPAAPAPAATKKKTTKKTPKSSTTSSAAPAPVQTQSAAPAPAPSKPSTPAPAAKTGVSGTFVGGTAQTRWGPVQVQINVKDGIITSVDPLQYPMTNGTDQYINKQAIPLLNGEVKNMSLATAMAEATKYLNGDPNATVGVGGASYTSSGYLVSMQSAIKKAGL